MKKYTEICEEITTINGKIKEYKNAIDADKAENQRRYAEAMERYKARDKNALKAFSDSKTDNLSLYINEENAQFAKRILQHNAKVALVMENLPIFIDILNKYAGKRIGDKTENKIKDEFKTATGLYGFFSRSYNGCINGISISTGNYLLKDNSVDVVIKYGVDIFNSDGKLNTLTIESFSLCGYEESAYINDIDAYIEKKKAEINVINEKCRELANLMKEYNASKIDGLIYLQNSNFSENGYRIM